LGPSSLYLLSSPSYNTYQNMHHTTTTHVRNTRPEQQLAPALRIAKKKHSNTSTTTLASTSTLAIYYILDRYIDIVRCSALLGASVQRRPLRAPGSRARPEDGLAAPGGATSPIPVVISPCPCTQPTHPAQKWSTRRRSAARLRSATPSKRVAKAGWGAGGVGPARSAFGRL
jgi:hypothetical protein